MCNMTATYRSGEKEPLTSLSQEETAFSACANNRTTAYSLENRRGKAPYLIVTLVPAVALRLCDFSFNYSWSFGLYSCLSLVVAALTHMIYQQRVLTRSLLSKVPSSDNIKTATTATISSTIKRISSNQCWESLHGKTSHSKNQHVTTLSNNDPFVSLDVISKLTLSDVTQLLLYAKDKNSHRCEGTTTSAALEQVMTALDTSASKSRGPNVIERNTLSSDAFGDMDALRFCAAVRIFGEWRVVRQVPDGYKGYAVGMNLGKRDIVQNLAKMEHAVHNWIDHNRNRDEVLKSPSLRDLLVHEVNTNVHHRLPKLKEKTAAIGLVWTYRQLQYQTCVYANMVNGEYNKAALDAYKEVYDKYHGWAVQKMFKYSFQGAPPEHEIYRHMNPELLQQVTDKVKNESTVLLRSASLSSLPGCSFDDESFVLDQESDSDDWEIVPNVTESSFLFDSDDEEDSVVNDKGKAESKKNRLEEALDHIVRETKKFEKNMERGWNEFVSSIVSVFDKDHKQKTSGASHSTNEDRSDDKEKSVDQRRRECFKKKGQDHSVSEDQTEALNKMISTEMTNGAHSQMKHYLKVAQPMMDDLLSMVKELNMNDPTKV